MKRNAIMFICVFVIGLCFYGCGDKNESGAITGDVIDVSASAIEIAAGDGENFRFSLSETDSSAVAKGDTLAKGDNVSVYYQGELDDGNLEQTATVTNVRLNQKATGEAAVNNTDSDPTSENTEHSKTDNADNTAGGTNTENTTKTVEGEIVDASMENITIQAKDGNTYSFNKEDATVNMGSDGLMIGEDVVITYEGELDLNKELTAMQIEED